MLQELLADFESQPKAVQAEAKAILDKETKGLKWIPNPGPQTDAYFSKADVLLYGGAAAGGKSELLLGLAITKHERSLVMRRKYTDLAFLTDRAIEIWGSRKGFNGSAPPRFAIGKRLIEFGAAQTVGDELSWMGRPHDLLGIDEAAHFAEQQIRALMGWVRSPTEGQRVRVVLGSNPPLSDEGAWMFKMFGPWLDPAFPNPAKPGELRWCIVDDENRDIWVDGPGEYELNGKMVRAMSRTFIPAKLKDNPFQDTPEYRAQQDGLPKHLRDALRDGNFLAVRKDHELQVIPTAWIQSAMDKWTPEPPENTPMCAVGVDVAQGGEDNTTLAMRYDGWFDRLVVVPGKETPLGKDVAALVITNRRDSARPVIDMGGGYGGSTYEHLLSNAIESTQYKGAKKSTARTRNSKIPFHNKRAEAYYRFMEDLDPGQPGGSRITLPPDELLRADLCSIRFDDTNSDINLIKLEPKKKLIARIGRSTDYSDPVIMAWTSGAKIATHYKQWHTRRNPPKVIRRK